jgi:hypothetical protein
MGRRAGSGSSTRARLKRWGLLVPSSLAVALSVAALGGLSFSGAPATAASPTLPPPTTFVYTGGEQTYAVPAGVVVVLVRAVGGFGGPGFNQGSGDGEDLTAYLPVTPNQQLSTEVGQVGSVGGGIGFGGGGASGSQSNGLTAASSGGGATDVRTCSQTASACPGGGTSGSSRLIVAGGGGGAGGSSPSQFDACGGGLPPPAALCWGSMVRPVRYRHRRAVARTWGPGREA